MRCTCCLFMLTLWSAAAGCNNRMPMCIGSFSLHSKWIGLSKRYPNSSVLRRDVESDRLIGNMSCKSTSYLVREIPIASQKKRIIPLVVLNNDYTRGTLAMFGKTDYVSNGTRLWLWLYTLVKHSSAGESFLLLLCSLLLNIYRCDTYYVSGSELESI